MDFTYGAGDVCQYPALAFSLAFTSAEVIG